MFGRLRQLWRPRPHFTRVEKLEKQWNSVVPGIDTGKDATDHVLDPIDGEELGHDFSSQCVPSDHIMRDDPYRRGEMLGASELHVPNLFDGGWELKSHCRSASTKKYGLNSCVIEGNTLMTANMTSHQVEQIRNPDVILFGDTRGHLLLDGTLEFVFAHQLNLVYERVQLPNKMTLTNLQGEWVRCNGVEVEDEYTLQIQGACIEVTSGSKTARVLLRAGKDGGSANFQGNEVHGTVDGSLFVRTKSGKLVHYRRTDRFPFLSEVSED